MTAERRAYIRGYLTAKNGKSTLKEAISLQSSFSLNGIFYIGVCDFFMNKHLELVPTKDEILNI